MKKFLLLFGMAAFFCGMKAQTTIDEEDFETGYVNGESILGVNGWQGWGTDFVFPATNVVGGGAEGTDWYARMETTTTTGWAVTQRVYELTVNQTYEYTIWIKPDVEGQIGAYKLEVIDPDGNAVVGPAVKGSGGDWQALTIVYTATATKNYAFRLTKGWGNAGVSMDNISLVQTTATDINAQTIADKVTVYPNPATDVINIAATDVDIASVELMALTGAVVYKSNATTAINVSELSKGLYILKLETATGEVSTQKVMIK